jgi:hypothetical protein
MERKIRGDEAKAAALVEIGEESFEAQFRELEEDGDIEAELQALKSGSVAGAAALPEGASQDTEQRDEQLSS